MRVWGKRIGWALLCAVLAFVGIAVFPAVFPNLGRNQGLAAGKERVPDGEAQAIDKIVSGIRGIQQRELDQRRHVDPSTKALRDAHAKAHGCVKATFTVERDLPPELAVGVFAVPRPHDAWLRFSNSERLPQPDLKKDARGMAVKLVGLEQDFVMINHPVFFVRNAADYIDFVEAQDRNSKYGFFLGARPPWTWRLHEMWCGLHITGHEVRSPLEERYFSMTPYALGDRAVKFSAKPCAVEHAAVPASGDDALRVMMIDRLQKQPACFEFQVQLQGDPHAMPVEDPTIEWSEAASPFRTVARIDIPAQSFVENDAECENFSFTPWHAQPAHRPLGGINRVRKAAYDAISTWRHGENHAERKEP